MSYHSAEKQSVYSTSPANWVTEGSYVGLGSIHGVLMVVASFLGLSPTCV